jgi:hypothetical protein
MLAPSTKFFDSFDAPPFEPAVNWQDSGEYPAIKLELEPGDYLRLAWEVMRRSPRYRWHHKRLKQDGLLEVASFPGGLTSITSRLATRFPGWQSVRADMHFTAPKAEPGEKLPSYVKRQTGSWLVAQGNWHVRSGWGISEVLDPATPAADIDLSKFFSPSRPRLMPVYAGRRDSGEAEILFPGRVSTDLSDREVLIWIRLDMPEKEQLALAEEGVSALRMRLGFKPQKSNAPRMRKQQQRAALWLRMWDAKHSGIDSRDAKQYLRRSFEDAATRIGDVRAATEVREWIRKSYDRIKSDGMPLIDTPGGEAFLFACLTGGLRAIEEPDYFFPVWRDA